MRLYHTVIFSTNHQSTIASGKLRVVNNKVVSLMGQFEDQ